MFLLFAFPFFYFLSGIFSRGATAQDGPLEDAFYPPLSLGVGHYSPSPSTKTPALADQHLTTSRPGESFPAYLERLWPARYPQPYFWLTIADSYWIDHGTAHLEHFIRWTLNFEEERKTRLIVLCVDEECMCRAEERGWFAFGGFGAFGEEGKPEMILKHTWPKLKGMIDILASGRDAFFVDSDVYFTRNPYPHMGSLDSYDIQIQEEMIDRQVNTGFLHMKANEGTVALWESVLEIDLQEQGRDQRNINILLDTFSLRVGAGGSTTMDFISATGLKVHVLPKEKFRAYHFEFDRMQYDSTELCYLHMTCADDNNMKDYVAGSSGYWQDVSARYSLPPLLLTSPSFIGSREQIVQQVKILLAAAHYSGRSFLPPTHGFMTDLYPPEVGNPMDAMRYSFSLFPLHELSDVLGEVNITELSYIEHAQSTLLRNALTYPLNAEADLDSLSLLSDIVEIDMRGVVSFKHLVSLLLTKDQVGWWHDGRPAASVDAYVDPADWQISGGEWGFAGRGVVRLVNWNWANGEGGWETWKVPKRVERFVDLCGEVARGPECGQICRPNDIVMERIERGELEQEEWEWQKMEDLE
ncbi:hypothetical protein BT69DRAFT_1336709 [Atractiella rhizophila]|nr:hypothetical protein BT69DRAFT_1336709 [Atractiella rhizophila]